MPNTIHLHAIFMGWIAIVIVQSWLVVKGRIALHIRFGKIGMAYGVVLIVSGLGFSLMRYAAAWLVEWTALRAGSWRRS